MAAVTAATEVKAVEGLTQFLAPVAPQVIVRSESITKLMTALAACQKEFAPIEKSAENPHFKSSYAPLSEVIKNTLPILNKHGLAFTQHIGVSPSGRSDVLTTLLFETKSGEYIESTMRLHLDKRSPQGQGSAVTYAKRYAYQSILGIVTEEDDDGERAEKDSPSLPKREQDDDDFLSDVPARAATATKDEPEPEPKQQPKRQRRSRVKADPPDEIDADPGETVDEQPEDVEDAVKLIYERVLKLEEDDEASFTQLGIWCEERHIDLEDFDQVAKNLRQVDKALRDLGV